MPKKYKNGFRIRNKYQLETYQILTNDDEVCIPSLSSILLAVMQLEELSGCLAAAQ